jgi:signal transduction histidine kinase
MRAFRLSVLEAGRGAAPSLVSAVAIVAIAIVDWKVHPNLSLGFLYIFPILVLALVLSTPQLLVACAICALLREVLSPLPLDAGVWMRTSLAFVSFFGGGFVVSELSRNRKRALAYAAELEDQIERRREAEEELRVLVSSSPAAILTADRGGRILHANDAAHRLLAAEGGGPAGESLASFLPALASALDRPDHSFRTSLECMGRRGDGGVFLAQVWFSTYRTLSGPRLTAIVLDASEQLRDREASGLDAIVATSRVLFGAVSHEVRNLSAAAAVAHKNLARNPDVAANEDFKALGALVEGLQRIASSELRLSSHKSPGSADLYTVLDELRIVIEPTFRDTEMTLELDVAPGLPRVAGDPHGLLQIFLNLARNSHGALARSIEKRLLVVAAASGENVTVRFRDTGPGVACPDRLFRPFDSGRGASGLGLFVSRTIARSFAGDIRYEPDRRGCCFAVRLVAAKQAS